MCYEQRNIKISSIEIENQKFKITTRKNIHSLIQSMNRIGLINPIVVLCQKNGFIVIGGFHRLEAAMALGWSKIRASVLPSTTPLTDCVRISISDNSFQRSLNLIEISKALALLKKTFITPEAMEAEVDSLNLPGGMHYLKKVEPLCRMPQSVQDGILSDSISLPTAWQLSRMPENEAVAFASIFAQLNCSLNKQREIITLVKEISIRESKSMVQLLMEDSIKHIVFDNNLDKNQKTRQLRFNLRKRRYPTIVESEENFYTQVQTLGLGERFKLIPPQDFEGDTYRLTLDFKSLQELKEHQKKLDHIIANPILRKIIS